MSVKVLMNNENNAVFYFIFFYDWKMLFEIWYDRFLLTKNMIGYRDKK